MAAFDKIESKIKMVILTKPGLENKVWYNFLKENEKPLPQIIRNMMRRFKDIKLLVSQAQVIQFYDNKTNKLIEEHKM